MLEELKCTECGATYEPPTGFCQRDGKQLVVTRTLIGRELHGKYKIDKWLGGGGMASVYRATHLRMGEEVAVKVLNPELVGKERMAARFRNEARAAMRVNHPNAIKVTDFDITEDNLHYLVMEIVKGRVLRELVDEAPFDYRRMVMIISQACEAIDAAHKQGIIHRDLKPDNIIIQNEDGVERVKVLDFGIARLREIDNPNSSKAVVTAPGIYLGTPPYMSPEQCQSKEMGPASDVYSIGVVAYEMLAQRTPFTFSGDLRDIFNQVKNDPPSPVSLYARETPASIERVIMRALEKDQDDRPSSALALAQELRNAVKEAGGRTIDPIANKTTIIIEKKWSWRPILMAAAGAGAAAVILYLLYLAALPGKTPRKETAPAINDDFGRMILIPGGKFKMGYDKGDEDEQPAYDVEVEDYYLDEHEVTNQQYKKFVEKTGRPAPKHWINGAFPPEEAQAPVTHVTWTDAEAYARWAGKRLATEKEWEYAARSGRADFNYPWGVEWKQGNANVERGAAKPAPVGSFENDRSQQGVYDLAGNVSEWVQDDYLRYVGKGAFSSCPGCKVFRGGNFVDEVKDSRASKRWAIFPEVREEFAENVFPRVGFRCARKVQ
ncbi:MAG TPA: bifunctional serine/threonine-protein kinase/formylglycine-generating enzyme family protein [Blastocatellia bacterium]|nr:bifunctional serine/threonine-protein kinase/formylglycine-generating enzyme family protein [Blastocatellia bacterium]